MDRSLAPQETHFQPASPWAREPNGFQSTNLNRFRTGETARPEARCAQALFDRDDRLIAIRGASCDLQGVIATR